MNQALDTRNNCAGCANYADYSDDHSGDFACSDLISWEGGTPPNPPCFVRRGDEISILHCIVSGHIVFRKSDSTLIFRDTTDAAIQVTPSQMIDIGLELATLGQKLLNGYPL